MRRITAISALVLLLAAGAYPQARRRRAAPKPPPKPAPKLVARSPTAPDDGEVVGHTYSNKFFGLRLTIPPGWVVLNEVGKREFMERSKSALSPKSAAEQKLMEQSLARSYNLLTAGQHAIAPQGETSASLLCVAERLPFANLTARQYMALMKDNLTRTTFKYEIVGESADEQVAGQEAILLKLKVESPLGPAQQEYRVVIRQGFALAFIATYWREEQRSLLNQSLESVTFERAGK